MSLFLIAILVGAALTALVRQVCLRWRIFDVPNARSAHSVPVPTLGGVAIVVGFWILVVGCFLFEVVLPPNILGLLAASVVLCILIRDELQAMGWVSKLGCQFLAGVCVVLGGNVLSSISWGTGGVELGVFGFWGTVLGLMLLQNLFNFMDGLDGFAASNGILVSGALAILFWQVLPGLMFFCLGVCGLTLGFWFWNKPPAKIFMGDVGAHFLPLCFGCVAIWGERSGKVALGVVLLPLGAFLCDAVYTLIRRLLRGENITQAHRFHIYQRLQAVGWTPWAINGVYAILTVLFSGSALLWQFEQRFDAWGVLGGAMVFMGIGVVYVEQKFRKVADGGQW